jgi:hypothetical protein
VTGIAFLMKRDESERFKDGEEGASTFLKVKLFKAYLTFFDNRGREANK